MAARKNAEVGLTLNDGRFRRGIRESGNILRSFARDGRKSLGDLDRSTASMVGASAKKLGRGVGKVAVGAAATGLGLVGVAAVSLFDDLRTLEKGLTRFQIATGMSGDKMGEFRTDLSAAARESGLNRQELLNGAAAYVALTGDAAGAASGMRLFGRVSNATGASMEDIAATAAAMKDNLKIDPSEFEAMFSALAVQGKAGAVELRELATQLAGVAPSFAQFKGGSGTAGLVEMGSALQVVRKGFGSSAEAATGLRALMVAVQRNAGKFKGVKIYDRDPKTGRKTLRDFSDIIDAIGKSKLARDPTLLTKAFGSDEAKRAYDQLVQNRGLMDELIAKSGDKNAIDRDAKAYLESPAARVTKSWEAAKQKLAEVFTPERIAAFASALEGVVATMGKLVDSAEILGRMMGGDDSKFFNSKIRGQVAGMRASAGLGVVLPTADAFKTSNMGTETSLPIVSQFEGIGRDFLGRARDRNMGEMVRAGLVAMQTVREQRATPAERFMRQLPGGNIIVQATLQVDGNAVAKAAANAPIHRTRPGGV